MFINKYIILFFKQLVFTFFLLEITSLYSQSSQKKERFIGIIGSTIIPIDYFGAGPLDINHDHSSITLSSKFGYQLKNVQGQWELHIND